MGCGGSTEAGASADKGSQDNGGLRVRNDPPRRDSGGRGGGNRRRHSDSDSEDGDKRPRGGRRQDTSDSDEERVQIGEGSSAGLKTFSASQFEKTSEYDYLFKILLLGSQGVGKSSLLARFADNEFLDSYRTTVGVDFKIRTVDIDDKTVKLQLWDTAGQERFKTVTNTYFRGAHGVILVYDVTDGKSFSQINDYWLNEVRNNAPENAVLMIVGNKIDLDRNVSTKQGKDFAQNKDALFLETSAKADQNVSRAFLSLAETIKSRIK
eukprot:TRINITY_DN14466_c0_g1_i1.p1 TRINITY_DN14466_c0_g1~~TRINITY_DN14466_c0_g1_i1.p1  ORF type:complete len:266 (-),score=32.44 TRINITY_DN14466_c0_g1_i1:103-900(-)